MFHFRRRLRWRRWQPLVRASRHRQLRRELRLRRRRRRILERLVVDNAICSQNSEAGTNLKQLSAPDHYLPNSPSTLLLIYLKRSFYATTSPSPLQRHLLLSSKVINLVKSSFSSSYYSGTTRRILAANIPFFKCGHSPDLC